MTRAKKNAMEKSPLAMNATSALLLEAYSSASSSILLTHARALFPPVLSAHFAIDLS